MEKYEEIKTIGKGSFGKAILVRRKEDNELLVLKIINVFEMSQKERDDAMNEVNLLASLNNENIIAYHESFIVDGQLVIAMEYANAGDIHLEIKQRILKKKPFREFEILSWFAQICNAIQYIAQRNILHRDLKTQNIFLTIQNGFYYVKLGDFGIAKILNSDTSFARTVIGTPYYLSPEICEDRPYDHKSDVWSLGCVLYELATLKHAFNANSLPALIIKILKGTYPPIPSYYSNDLRNLISCMLQTDPKKRPSISEILAMPLLKAYIGRDLKPFSVDDPNDEKSTPTTSSSGVPSSGANSNPTLQNNIPMSIARSSSSSSLQPVKKVSPPTTPTSLYTPPPPQPTKPILKKSTPSTNPVNPIKSILKKPSTTSSKLNASTKSSSVSSTRTPTKTPTTSKTSSTSTTKPVSTRTPTKTTTATSSSTSTRTPTKSTSTTSKPTPTAINKPIAKTSSPTTTPITTSVKSTNTVANTPTPTSSSILKRPPTPTESLSKRPPSPVQTITSLPSTTSNRSSTSTTNRPSSRLSISSSSSNSTPISSGLPTLSKSSTITDSQSRPRPTTPISSSSSLSSPSLTSSNSNISYRPPSPSIKLNSSINGSGGGTGSIGGGTNNNNSSRLSISSLPSTSQKSTLKSKPGTSNSSFLPTSSKSNEPYTPPSSSVQTTTTLPLLKKQTSVGSIQYNRKTALKEKNQDIINTIIDNSLSNNDSENNSNISAIDYMKNNLSNIKSINENNLLISNSINNGDHVSNKSVIPNDNNYTNNNSDSNGKSNNSNIVDENESENTRSNKKNLSTRVNALRHFCNSIFGESLFLKIYNFLKHEYYDESEVEEDDLITEVQENEKFEKLKELAADQFYYVKYVQQLLYCENKSI